MPTPQLASTTPAKTACPESGVTVSTSQVDAAMGTRAVQLYLTNCGQQPYQVTGYPVIGLLDENRKPIDNVTVHEDSSFFPGSPAPTPVTVAPGGREVAVLTWRNTVGDGAPVNGTYLSVAPTAGAQAQTVELRTDIGTTGAVTVTSWVDRLPGNTGG